MSIVTLKRKTSAQYNNMSVGQKNFSINGTLRNQGYVGQTSLSRSLPKTMMNGNVKCGHGGCCGTFQNRPIIQSAVTSLNNPNVIKSSSINTRGLISTKYRWINRPQPFTTVKPDNNQHTNTQQSHIDNIKKKAIICEDLSYSQPPTTYCANKDAYLFNGPKIKYYTKPTSDYVPISQGEYLVTLIKKCTQYDVSFNPAPTRNTPFACGISS